MMGDAFIVDYKALLREIQRWNLDVVEVDVLPDVQFGFQFESGNTRMLSPLVDLAVVEVPQLRALVLGIPAVVFCRGRSRRAPLARDFSSSRRAPPKAASNLCLFSACFSACVFMMSVWLGNCHA